MNDVDTQRVELAREIVAGMTDEAWMDFAETEKNRRNDSVSPLPRNQRVRFPANTKPKRIALATGRIVDVRYYNGKWTYSVKLDHPVGNGEIFIRISRTQIEVIALDVPTHYAGVSQARRATHGRYV